MHNVSTYLNKEQSIIAKPIIKEINQRIELLLNLGLDYLSLDRPLRTLSGGEAQRIRLATQIGTRLVGVLYILDEPSIGLHQRDNNKLIDSLKELRDLGNTIIVVEHDRDMMLNADNIIDIGPGPGTNGGVVVAEGNPELLSLIGFFENLSILFSDSGSHFGLKISVIGSAVASWKYPNSKPHLVFQ